VREPLPSRRTGRRERTGGTRSDVSDRVAQGFDKRGDDFLRLSTRQDERIDGTLSDAAVGVA